MTDKAYLGDISNPVEKTHEIQAMCSVCKKITMHTMEVDSQTNTTYYKCSECEPRSN